MLIVTTSISPGHEITEALGLVRGTTVRARHIGNDIIGMMKGFVEVEVHEYTKVVAEVVAYGTAIKMVKREG